MSAPVVYEVNTRVWLDDLEHRAGRPMTLLDVPKEAWDDLHMPGVDVVWLMGVWRRSPAGRAVALADPALMAGLRQALPDLTDGDVAGSPYCVREYVADDRLGGPEGLAAARTELDRQGLGLYLDYVPNHVAPDHPWTAAHPEYFVQGSAADLEADPVAFVRLEGGIYARGRDPNFPPWPDVVQLDAFSAELRSATARTLSAIGKQCDGVRCDMAMLMMNDVFARTWGERAGAPPATDFWPAVIEKVRERHPDMVFMAEAYWDLEWALQQQGFDYCYDKRLYDRLLHADAGSVRAHLRADPGYQRGLVRFLENHDEPRLAAVLGPDRARAAAVAIATLPGATLWHEGQFEGRRVQVPVFLARRPAEPAETTLRGFYERLLVAVHLSGMRTGEWRLLEATGWPDNPSAGELLAWSWSGAAGARHLVIVNFSDHPSQGRVALPFADLAGRTWRFDDLLAGAAYHREGTELQDPGLYVDLGSWGYHVFALRPEG